MPSRSPKIRPRPNRRRQQRLLKSLQRVADDKSEPRDFEANRNYHAVMFGAKIGSLCEFHGNVNQLSTWAAEKKGFMILVRGLEDVLSKKKQ